MAKEIRYTSGTTETVIRDGFAGFDHDTEALAWVLPSGAMRHMNVSEIREDAEVLCTTKAHALRELLGFVDVALGGRPPDALSADALAMVEKARTEQLAMALVRLIVSR